MDRRTLQRHLAVEGTSFTLLLESTRRNLAESLLTSSGRPLQRVAEMLGFSSLSAFAHWFRRQFGRSASEYRAQRFKRVDTSLAKPIDRLQLT
jgi:AraC-like DNA-binding protein